MGTFTYLIPPLIFSASTIPALIFSVSTIFQLGKPDLGLEKICFAPLSTSSSNNQSNCAVQSIWGYYKNNEAMFNRIGSDREGFPTNYLDQFLKCSQ